MPIPTCSCCPPVSAAEATQNLPSYQSVDDAYKVPAKIIEALPPSTERNSAERHLQQSYAYAKEARERAKLREADE
jgi:hypothetical protein